MGKKQPQKNKITIEEFKNLLLPIISLRNKLEEKLPYSFILLKEIHPNENDHSRVLKRLLEYKGPQASYPFLASFLQNLVFTRLNAEEEQKRLTDFCQNPQIDFNKNFIDISVKSAAHFLIIENKVEGAEDRNTQLETYINLWKHKKEVWAIYLTLDGTKKPAEISLTNQALKDLNIRPETADRSDSKYEPIESQKPIRFVELNYKNDLLPWLENKVMREVPLPGKETLYLFPHLQVYIDSLKYNDGNLLEEQKQMTKEILNAIYTYMSQNPIGEHTEKGSLDQLLQFQNKLQEINKDIETRKAQFQKIIHSPEILKTLQNLIYQQHPDVELIPAKNNKDKEVDKGHFRRFFLKCCEKEVNHCEIHLEIVYLKDKEKQRYGETHIGLHIEPRNEKGNPKQVFIDWNKRLQKKGWLSLQYSNIPGGNEPLIIEEEEKHFYSKAISDPIRNYTDVQTFKQAIFNGLISRQEDINKLITIWREYAKDNQASK